MINTAWESNVSYNGERIVQKIFLIRDKKESGSSDGGLIQKQNES